MPTVRGEYLSIMPPSSFGERTQGRYCKVRPLLFGLFFSLDQAVRALYRSSNNTRQASAKACSNWRVTFFQEGAL